MFQSPLPGTDIYNSVSFSRDCYNFADSFISECIEISVTKLTSLLTPIILDTSQGVLAKSADPDQMPDDLTSDPDPPFNHFPMKISQLTLPNTH